MPALHAHFLLKNQQAFQRLLEASKQSLSSASTGGGGSNVPPLSSSGGRSWTRPGSLSALSGPPSCAASVCDVNERDWLGRTVLHLAVSSLESSALEFVKLLLAHPRIDVNLADVESRWTSLHRALYAGNLAACVLLLQRSDIDMSLKDFEGYTAFDLYNSTVEGTKPNLKDALDLFTWGANRNACLGLGDGNDRAFAEQVVVNATNHDEGTSKRTLAERFEPIRIRQVAMSKLHTTIVTNEKKANLRVCGFGSGGRLGLGQHTQYNLVPIRQLQTCITAVALGQDHTIALTENGDVLSWGMNRFSQLGYVIEATSSGAPSGKSLAPTEEQIQLIPRRVIGPLKKEVAVGVAACRTASACWTESVLYTWGTNNGQLGYEKTAQPGQVLPRKVAAVSHVMDVAMTDYAMACLLKTLDVVCFWNGRHFKINFPTQIFPSEIQTYRPPMALNNASIAKVVCHEGSGTFAALSVNGETFTFSLNAPPVSTDGAMHDKHLIKPQRIWALRKQFSAVKDVTLGVDGAIILCTESGHVYIRSRNPKAGQSSNAKTFKFQRIPYLQRVVRVSANTTGAFGALRAECKPAPISIVGNTPAQDMSSIRPFAASSPETSSENISTSPVEELRSPITDDAEVDEDTEDTGIQEDVKSLRTLIESFSGVSTQEVKQDVNGVTPQLHGANLVVEVGSSRYPVHSVILASRSSVLKGVLSGQTVKDGKFSIACIAASTHSTRKLRSLRLNSRPTESLHRMIFSGVHPLTVLIFLHYIYTDALLSPWDRRIESPLTDQLAKLKISGQTIKLQLLTISKVLGFKQLTAAVDWHNRRAPSPTLDIEMSALFQNTQEKYSSSIVIPPKPMAPDAVLQLRDKTVYCHSTILRARSAFFSGLFDDDEWTINRWSPNGTIEINLRHMRWQVFDFVIRFIYGGGGEEMFNVLDFAGTVDNVVEFMFEVMAVASELLLDRLMLVCSSVILRHITILNVCSVLAEATYYHADDLCASLQGYMSQNMETFLESRMLDDLPDHLVKQLAAFVRKKQAEKLPTSRSRELVEELLVKHGEWLALQDIPQPFVPNYTKAVHRLSPKVSPTASTKKSGKRAMTVAPPPSSPSMIGIAKPLEVQRTLSADPAVQGDDIFQMDEIEKDAIPPLSLPPTGVSSTSQPGVAIPTSSKFSEARPWKMSVAQAPAKSDFRSILAEAESSKTRPTAFPVNRSASAGQGTQQNISSSPSTSARNLNDRYKARPINAPDSSVDGTQARSSMPWRLPASPAPFPTPLPQTSREMPTNTPPSGLSRIMREGPTASSSSGSPVQPQTTPTKGDSKGKALLGPMFTPTKSLVPPAPSVSRRTSETSNPWAVTPSTPPEPEPMLPSSSPPSFLAIQKQQLDQGKAPAKAKKSLLQIQEEEQARQQEEDFMKWWAAEEERIKAESATLQESGEVDKKAKRSRRKPPFKGTMSKSGPAALGETAQISSSAALGGESKPQSSKNRRPRGRQSSAQAQQL
ncbi:hypothetical protein SCHPADRAFT_820098 [Schizopora paradoxa]|uniref:BTB domain-containing protein n=1 Tax=Schizopora paradoxa TaxID=27342 RepID=A0A0H2S1L8_9AGAM|nr:hypothetical protein SCHPADRAFT_820098 [Schizopora paradoxa]